MNSSPSTIDAAYLHFVEILLRRHRLLCEGRSEELDEIEDDLSTAWEGLDEGQRRSVNGIGSDLNWVRRRGAPAANARTAEEVSDAERAALAATEADGDPEAVLHLLRVCSPAMEFYDLAERRMRAYTRAGLPQVAAVFGGPAQEGATPPRKGDASEAISPPVGSLGGRKGH